MLELIDTKKLSKNLRLISRECVFLSALIVVPQRLPDAVITGFRLEETKDLKKTLDMKAPSAEIFKKEQIAKAISPKTRFFQSNGTAIELSSSETLANLVTRDLFFKDATEIKSPEGFIVQGRNLDYLHANGKVGTEEGIQFESTQDFKSASVQGWATGFEADLKAKSFLFQKDVHFTFVPHEVGSSPSKLRGDSARIFMDKGWAKIEGNVAFKNRNLSLRSDYLSINFDLEGNSENEEAIFQSDVKSNVVSVFDNYKLSSKEVTLVMKDRKEIAQIVAKGEVVIKDDAGLQMSTEKLEIVNPQGPHRKMKLSGNVYIKRGMDEAKCRTASFDPDTDDLLLTGDASFTRGRDILAGEEIRYSKKRGVIEINRASGQLQKSKIIPKKTQ